MKVGDTVKIAANVQGYANQMGRIVNITVVGDKTKVMVTTPTGSVTVLANQVTKF
jgi:hypothetical protein